MRIGNQLNRMSRELTGIRAVSEEMYRRQQKNAYSFSQRARKAEFKPVISASLTSSKREK